MNANSSSVLRWTRRNLIATPGDGALTLVLALFCGWAVWHVLDWSVHEAHWEVVTDSLRVFLVGTLPAIDLWRAWVALGLIGVMIGAVAALGFTFRGRHILLAVLLLLISVTFLGQNLLALAAVVGVVASFAASWLVVARLALGARHIGYGVSGILALTFLVLAPAGTDRWGGLLLSVVFTLGASFFMLMFGVLLAFGRRSRHWPLRTACIFYIESMRALPLILIVYWIWLAGPLLLPDWDLAAVTRAMAGFVVYFSAVAAESIRGGLQGLPKGQQEAARSLGLSEFAINTQILLPQALRAAVPALMGNILDVFNFVPVIFIVGLADFLRTGEMVLASPSASARTYEVFVFMLVIYCAIGSVLTFVARGLEQHLSRGSRRLSELV